MGIVAATPASKKGVNPVVGCTLLNSMVFPSQWYISKNPGSSFGEHIPIGTNLKIFLVVLF